MPELPEVETVKCAIETSLLNKKVSSSILNRQKIRFDIPSHFNEKIKNTTFRSVTRRSKYILIHLDNGYSILIHLGMSGRVYIHNEKPPTQKHDHWLCQFETGEMLIFNDPRRFGVLDILETDTCDTHPLLKKIGPEPFSPSFDDTYFYEALKMKNTPIKTAILDQSLVAGVGNIYACEALFRSNISPFRKSNSLKQAETKKLRHEIIETLQEAIQAGGSSLKDFHHTDGSLGYFQHRFKVYDQENNPCPNCTCNGEHTIVRETQSGRSTYYCPVKQK